MTRESVAIAVFVKTPGLSPLKTRLAEGIGAERSAKFYRLSVMTITATVAAVVKATGAIPYWAVAEEAGIDDPLWRQFPKIVQGSGNLGTRLNKVFDELRSQHHAVIIIGADSPQISPAILKKAIQSLTEDSGHFSHVLGRSLDGGFYLVGSTTRLSQETWCEVPYSTDSTAESLAAQLRVCGQINELVRLVDVDRAEDLPTLQRELRDFGSLTPEQQMLLKWLVQYD